MIHLIIGDMRMAQLHPDKIFENHYKKKWFDDEFVKDMIKDVDKSEVITPRCILSPVFGQIPPRMLSGGVKALMLLKFDQDRFLDLATIGKNCVKWLMKLGREQEVYVATNHCYLVLPEPFNVEILNDNSMVHTNEDLFKQIHRFSRNFSDRDMNNWIYDTKEPDCEDLISIFESSSISDD